MTLIDNAVNKLFGYTQESFDLNSVGFMKQHIKNAPNILGYYYDYTAANAIRDFLFEQTDIAKQLKAIMEKSNESDQEEHPQSIHE